MTTKLQTLFEAADGDCLFIRLGNQAAMLPLNLNDPSIDPTKIEAVNIDDEEQRKAFVVLVSSRVTTELISPEDKKKLEELAASSGLVGAG